MALLSKYIDLFNTLLILVSIGLAYFFPFELFIMVYAILGPLHYLTEINWIRDKNYFVSNRSWILIVVIFALIIALPSLLNLNWFDSSGNAIVNFIRNNLSNYTNGFILISLVLAYVFLFISNKKQRYIIIGLAILVILLISNLPVYNIWVGIFLPTIIHVYIFTLLFMWFGSLKTKNKIGYLNIILLALVPFIIGVLDVDIDNYEFSKKIKEIIISTRFYVLNTNISKFLGFTDGTSFFFYEIIDLKIQMMIAFAYTYHYLNWFSKTTVIGWHKKITTKKTLVIVFLWLFSVAIYFYDYKIGLSLLLFMSIAHVFLEFPINILAIKGIYNFYFKSNN